MRLIALTFAFMLYLWSASEGPKFSRAPASKSLIKGYNIAWWKEFDYGHQWNNGSFSKQKVIELLDLAERGDAKIVRVWLFEDHFQRQFAKDEHGEPTGLAPEFIPNLLFFLEECHKRGLKANLTLFDGNAYGLERLPQGRVRAWWYNVLNDHYDMSHWFQREVLSPLLEAIKDEGLADTVAQVEFMNEMDGAVKNGIFAHHWKSVGKVLCSWHKKIKPYGFVFGTSVGHQGAAKHIVDNDIPAECTDYRDLHVYNDTGEIPQCEWFQKQSAKGQRFQLGEFGQLNPAFDDAFQKKLTLNFLRSAQECGFESALAWRLEDIRPGHNREARYSYTAFGEPRPAWFVLRDFPQVSP